MLIYPLPPSELDDKTLDKQIKAIAQVLCNVHHYIAYSHYCALDSDEPYDFKSGGIPLSPPKDEKKLYDQYTKWASECRANYLFLVNMGNSLLEEHRHRFYEPCGCFHECNYKRHRVDPVIEWAEANVPDLPQSSKIIMASDETKSLYWLAKEEEITTPFPVVIPEKYIHECANNLHNLSDDDKKLTVSLLIYRNYYKTELQKLRARQAKKLMSIQGGGSFNSKIKWTRRQQPEWLND